MTANDVAYSTEIARLNAENDALRQANEHLRRENDRLRATSLPVQRSDDE